MVSKARDDFPEPDSPVRTISLSRGISTSMFLRLCSRAPLMTIFFMNSYVLIAGRSPERVSPRGTAWRVERIFQQRHPTTGGYKSIRRFLVRSQSDFVPGSPRFLSKFTVPVTVGFGGVSRPVAGDGGRPPANLDAAARARSGRV